ncbi:MAG: N-acetylmuramoyl-L-alanine amidase [Elusimicrobia bacterium]|nr:N-acetylmuramoyl-L-alanine amidase [Elusimicrobiota bacterium]
MRIPAALLFLAFAVARPSPALSQEIVLVRPREAETLPSHAKGVIVAGNVKGSPLSEILINDAPTPVFRTGAFVAYLPIPKNSGDNFLIMATTRTGGPALARKTVAIETNKPLGPKEQILSSLEPKTGLCEILPGEAVGISFQAPAGGQARYRIAGLTGKTSMMETRPGLYETRFVLAPNEVFDASKEGPLQIFFETPGGDDIKVETKRKIRVAKTGRWPKAARVIAANAKVLANIENGSYWFSVSSGTILTTDGLFGQLYRLRLAGALSGWIATSDVILENFLPKSPILSAIEVQENHEAATETLLRINWQENLQLPFLIERRGDDDIKIRLFNARIHLNWIPYKTGGQSSLIRSVSWTIPQEDEVDILVQLNRPLYWGYWAEAQKGGLALRLRRGRAETGAESRSTPGARQSIDPDSTQIRPSPYRRELSGLTVMLDAGHGGRETGAPGPSGTLEQHLNLRLTKEVAKRLDALGAQTILTRSATDQTVALEERVALAKRVNPDLFISIHINDFPSWVDPFARGPWGSSVYYYHNQSLGLAQRAGKELGAANLKIPSNGVLWSDLYVTREITIPAILIESGYVLFPWQEELLAWDSEFARLFAAAVGRAVHRYAQEAAAVGRKKRNLAASP